MDTQIQFQKDASVVAANHKPIGLIERVVVNPTNNMLTDIVVRTGALFNQEEKVVPLELIAETTGSQIVLSDEAGELKSFPHFEEKRTVASNADMEQSHPSANADNAPPVIYGMPGAGPALITPPREQFVTQIKQNIPTGTIAMKEGARVIAAEGKTVGNVERVLADRSVGQVTHLLISRGVFSRETKLIPIRWVTTIDEDEVHLRVKKYSVETLDNGVMHGRGGHNGYSQTQW